MSNTKFSNPVTSSGIGGPSPSSESVKGGVHTGNSPVATTHGGADVEQKIGSGPEDVDTAKDRKAS